MKTSCSKARLLWGCRRGMLELDTLLIPYVNDKYDHMSPVAKSKLAALLLHSDQDLYAWIVGTDRPGDTTMESIIQAIRNHRIPE